MRSESNSDLLELQSGIQQGLAELQQLLLSTGQVPASEKKKCLGNLRDKIRTLLEFSGALQEYGDGCYESSVAYQKELARLRRSKKHVQQKLQDREVEVMTLQKRLIEQEREIDRLKAMNRIDVSYISSVTFEESEVSQEPDNEEESETSVMEQSKIGSYYSLVQSRLQVRQEPSIEWDHSTDNLELLQELELLALIELQENPCSASSPETPSTS